MRLRALVYFIDARIRSVNSRRRDEIAFVSLKCAVALIWRDFSVSYSEQYKISHLQVSSELTIVNRH